MPLTAAILPKKGKTLGGLPTLLVLKGEFLNNNFIYRFFLQKEIRRDSINDRNTKASENTGRLLIHGGVVGTVVITTGRLPAPKNTLGFLEHEILHRPLHTLVSFNSLVILIWIMRLNVD